MRRLLLALVVFVALDQLVHRVVLSGGELLGRPVAPFDPPLFSDDQRASLERVRALVRGDGEGPAGASHVPFDAELGWCPRPDSGAGEYRYDWAGARIGNGPLARQKRAGVRRVVAVGCSFTHGDDAPASGSWAARVDAADELELANLGFGGYGLDQALLRLERDGLRLEPDEVWMGFLPFAAPRVGTLYRPVQRHWAGFVGFKPCFSHSGSVSDLRLVPSPPRTLADVPRLLDDQQAFFDALFPHDVWVRRARWAYLPRGSHWTHHAATTRLALTLFERGARDPAAWLADPGSDVRRILMLVVRRARAASEAAGARFRLLVLPSESDAASYAAGEPYWQGLVDDLKRDGVEVVDVTKVLATQARGTTPLWSEGGHYTPAGHRHVADALLFAARR